MIDQITSRRLFHKIARMARAAIGAPTPAHVRLAKRRVIAAARCEMTEATAEPRRKKFQ